jgi:branched-chain amino acid transport system permease protein
MDQVTIVFLDGIVFASYLFLVSAGLTFIYGVMRILNVAHGSLYGLGAYLAAWLLLQLWPGGASGVGGLSPVLSYFVLILAAVVVGVLAGPWLERVVAGQLPAFGAFLGAAWSTLAVGNEAVPLPLKILAPIVGIVLGVLAGRYLERAFPNRVVVQGEVIGLILTFAVFLIMDDVMKLVFGVNPYLQDLPYSMLGSIRIAGVSYERYKFLQLAVAVLAGLVMWLIVNRTLFGKLVTSVIADREVSAAMGINVPRVYTFAFAIGAIMAALGGAFIAPTSSVVPGISVEVIILAFAVTTIGGLGSVPGAAIGALLVGLLRSTAVHTVPELDLFVIYALMSLILLVKPLGLFGGLEARRI